MGSGAIPELPADVLLTDIAQFEALANPTRTRILLEASQPITVAEIAHRLGTPKTRLYYHVNLLVEAQLLVQVDERKSGARIERIYRVAARTFRAGLDVWDQTDDPRRAADLAAGVIFEPARAETAAVLEQGFYGSRPTAEFGRWLAYLTEQQAAGIEARLEEVLDDLREQPTEPRPQAQPYALTYAFVPTQLPNRRDEA